MRKSPYLILKLLLICILFMPILADASQIGCCTNPESHYARISICNEVSEDICCKGSKDYEKCINKHFHPGEMCYDDEGNAKTIAQPYCDFGCCCIQRDEQIVSMIVQKAGCDGEFHHGETERDKCFYNICEREFSTYDCTQDKTLCEEDEYCDEETGECVECFVGEEDCEEDQVCQEGVCVSLDDKKKPEPWFSLTDEITSKSATFEDIFDEINIPHQIDKENVWIQFKSDGLPIVNEGSNGWININKLNEHKLSVGMDGEEITINTGFTHELIQYVSYDEIPDPKNWTVEWTAEFDGCDAGQDITWGEGCKDSPFGRRMREHGESFELSSSGSMRSQSYVGDAKVMCNDGEWEIIESECGRTCYNQETVEWGGGCKAEPDGLFYSNPKDTMHIESGSDYEGNAKIKCVDGNWEFIESECEIRWFSLTDEITSKSATFEDIFDEINIPHQIDKENVWIQFKSDGLPIVNEGSNGWININKLNEHKLRVGMDGEEITINTGFTHELIQYVSYDEIPDPKNWTVEWTAEFDGCDADQDITWGDGCKDSPFGRWDRNHGESFELSSSGSTRSQSYVGDAKVMCNDGEWEIIESECGRTCYNQETVEWGNGCEGEPAGNRYSNPKDTMQIESGSDYEGNAKIKCVDGEWEIIESECDGYYEEIETWWFIADTHIGSERDWNSGKGVEELETAISDVNELDISNKALVLGDFVHDDPKYVEPFVDTMDKLNHDWTYVLGNHDFDRHGSGKRVMERVNFSKDIGGFRFIAISDDGRWVGDDLVEQAYQTEKNLKSSQNEWFKNELEKHSDEPVIILSHQGLRRMFDNENDDGPCFWDTSRRGWLQENWQDYNIKMWIRGHRHAWALEEDYKGYGFVDVSPGTMDRNRGGGIFMTVSKNENRTKLTLRFRDHMNQEWIEIGGYKEYVMKI